MITATPKVRIGQTDLLAPRIGLGTVVLGNFLQAISDEDAIIVLDRALTNGIRYLDTAPLYGHGLAEFASPGKGGGAGLERVAAVPAPPTRTEHCRCLTPNRIASRRSRSRGGSRPAN